MNIDSCKWYRFYAHNLMASRGVLKSLACVYGFIVTFSISKSLGSRVATTVRVYVIYLTLDFV